MERDNETVCLRFYGLAGPAARVLDRLLAGRGSAGRLLAAAREIGHAADRQDVTHAALKRAADRIYRKHGILAAPPRQDDGAGSAAARESEAGAGKRLAHGAGRTAGRRAAADPTDLRISPGRGG